LAFLDLSWVKVIHVLGMLGMLRGNVTCYKALGTCYPCYVPLCTNNMGGYGCFEKNGIKLILLPLLKCVCVCVCVCVCFFSTKTQCITWRWFDSFSLSLLVCVVFVSLQKPNASCEDGLAFSLSVSFLCVVFVFVYKCLMLSSLHHSIIVILKVS
jgi:hypothetical protein